MVSNDVLEQYETSLTNLLESATSHYLRSRSEQLSIEAMGLNTSAGSALLAQGQTSASERLETIADNAERYLDTADRLEREFDEDDEAGPDRHAALMGGDWLAVTALTTAAGYTPLPPVALVEIDSRRLAVAHDLPHSENLLRLLDESDLDLEHVVLAHGLDHDAADVFLGIRGAQPIAGGSEDKLDDSVSHVVHGLVKSVNSIAGSAAVSALLPQVPAAVAAFARGTRLQALLDKAGVSLKRLHKLLVKALDRAVHLARKLLGKATADKLEKWLQEHVTGLLKKLETNLAEKALQTDELRKECAATLRKLDPAARQKRLHALEKVGPDYDNWAKWGTKGARWLALAPAAMLGPAYYPVIGVAIVALFAYEMWVAFDHLDWPSSWPLPDAATGVHGVIVK